jgi:hypothetical protein
MFFSIITLMACFHKPLVHKDNVQQIAVETMKVAHPTASLTTYEIVGAEHSSKKGRYTDVAMAYHPLLQETALLTVRYYVLSTKPCRINVEVLSDTGAIPPLFLNEWAAEPVLSQFICDTTAK